MANQPPRRQRVASFRTQRVIATFVIYGLVFFFTTAVLWNHIDNIIAAGAYAALAKAGLLILPTVALIMTIWELFVDDVGARRRFKPHPTVVRLVNWCFWGAFILMACEIIHAGALLKFESSAKQQANTIKTLGEAQAGIAAATTKAAIESSGKVAKDFNQAGQRRSAQRTIASGQEVAAGAQALAQQQLAAAAARSAPDTFLPSWYIGGGMYVALPLLACLCFVITMAFARAANPFVDRDDDGRPDATQPRAEVAHESPKELEEETPQSARIEMKPSAAPLDALSEKLAKMGAVKMEETRLPNESKPEPASQLTPTTNKPSATGSKASRKAPVATGSNPLPSKAKVKPLEVGGYYWRGDGRGWQLRRSERDEQGNNPYVAHLSKTAYQKLKREHKGKALADALAQWVKDREREKGGGKSGRQT